MEGIVNRFFSKRISYYSIPRLYIEEEELFKRYLREKGRVLDLCCGAGRVAIVLAKNGFEVIGIDKNKKMISIANNLKKKMHLKGCEFICTDAIKFRAEREFDYVLIMENSLEHIPTKIKREKLLKNANKSLRRGGLLITSFHSYFYPPSIFFKILVQNLLNLIRKNHEFNDLILNTQNGPIYFHLFTPFEVEHLLRKTGFKKLAIISFNQLNKKRNRFKDMKIYHLFKPLLYNFYIAKKIKNIC
jgi:2-polyprenyl-3-methyl-5-hydroxy-6-metoxy-1,4-benzoquinol methylase